MKFVAPFSAVVVVLAAAVSCQNDRDRKNGGDKDGKKNGKDNDKSSQGAASVVVGSLALIGIIASLAC